MRLHLKDSTKLIHIDFGQWLIPKIQVRLLASASSGKLSVWDDYLTNSETISRLYDKPYSAMELLSFASKNLVCTGTDGEIDIFFKDTYVPGFDRLKLRTIMRTINNGTLTIKAYPIVTDTFEFFADNIDTYVNMFYGFN